MESERYYLPREVAEIVRAYLELLPELDNLRRDTAKPTYDKGVAELRRDAIRKKFEPRIPKNVLESLGLEDILQTSSQLPSSK